MSSEIRQKVIFPSATNLFLIIITCHFLAFSMTKFHFSFPTPKKRITLTFLGSIIDPSDMSKIKSQNYPTLDESNAFPLNKKQASRRNITELSKPDLNVFLKTQRKANFKFQPPEISMPQTEILFKKPVETKKELPTSQSYERLKLSR